MREESQTVSWVHLSLVAVRKAEGKYIAFLDSDDFWEKEKVYESVSILENSETEITYHDCFLVSGPQIKKTNPPTPPPNYHIAPIPAKRRMEYVDMHI